MISAIDIAYKLGSGDSKLAEHMVMTLLKRYPDTAIEIYQATMFGGISPNIVRDMPAKTASRVAELLRAGQRVEAVKEIRAALGYSLKEALDMAKEIDKDLGINAFA